jgi:type I restriction enzyme S subunit
VTAWPSVPLGEVCEIVGGGTPSRAVPNYYGGTIPWLTVKDLKSHNLICSSEHITAEAVAKSATRVLPPNTVVVATRIAVGATGIIKAHMAINQDLKGLIPRREVSPEYIAWFVSSQAVTLQRKSSGSTVKGITTGVLASLAIPLPPLDEQRLIVRLLDRAAEIKRRAGAARAKARAIIPALFLDTFGDPATNPMGWPVVTVGELLESAAYGTSQKANDRGEGIPMIRMGNVTIGGQLDTSDLKHIDIAGQEREKAEVLEGDLLFNRTNSKELVGKTGLWDGRFEAVAASYFIRLRVKRDQCSPAYLWAFFNTQFMKRALFDTARGAIGQANINAKELRAFRVGSPPLDLQTTFAEQVHRLEAVARHLDAAAAKADAMAAGLSAEVFA